MWWKSFWIASRAETAPRYSSAVLLYVLYALVPTASAVSYRLSGSLINLRQTLQYNGKSHVLETASEKFQHELYSYGNGEGHDSWEFTGLVSQRLSLRRRDEQTAGVDRALEVLQNRVAAAKKEREAQTYVHLDRSCRCCSAQKSIARCLVTIVATQR